jgi:hypothetical protein
MTFFESAYPCPAAAARRPSFCSVVSERKEMSSRRKSSSNSKEVKSFQVVFYSACTFPVLTNKMYPEIQGEKKKKNKREERTNIEDRHGESKGERKKCFQRKKFLCEEHV